MVFQCFVIPFPRHFIGFSLTVGMSSPWILNFTCSTFLFFSTKLLDFAGLKVILAQWIIVCRSCNNNLPSMTVFVVIVISSIKARVGGCHMVLYSFSLLIWLGGSLLLRAMSLKWYSLMLFQLLISSTLLSLFHSSIVNLNCNFSKYPFNISQIFLGMWYLSNVKWTSLYIIPGHKQVVFSYWYRFDGLLTFYNYWHRQTFLRSGYSSYGTLLYKEKPQLQGFLLS